MDIKKYLQNLDWWLVGAVCLLSLFGLICIASATRINLGESPANVIKQGVFFLIGIALMVIAANADYEYISQFTIPLYIVNILLLVTVLLVGSESKGATRWIALGPLTIQPSEFAKVIMIFCLAKVITERQKQIILRGDSTYHIADICVITFIADLQVSRLCITCQKVGRRQRQIQIIVLTAGNRTTCRRQRKLCCKAFLQAFHGISETGTDSAQIQFSGYSSVIIPRLPRIDFCKQLTRI